MKRWRDAARGLGNIARGRMFLIALASGVVVTTLGYLLQFSHLERIMIVAFVFVVLCLEGFNTTLERLLDIISPRYSKEIGVVKDMLAGTVLIAAIGAATIGVLILVRLVQLE